MGAECEGYVWGSWGKDDRSVGWDGIINGVPGGK